MFLRSKSKEITNTTANKNYESEYLNSLQEFLDLEYPILYLKKDAFVFNKRPSSIKCLENIVIEGPMVLKIPNYREERPQIELLFSNFEEMQQHAKIFDFPIKKGPIGEIKTIKVAHTYLPQNSTLKVEMVELKYSQLIEMAYTQRYCEGFLYQATQDPNPIKENIRKYFSQLKMLKE